MAGTGTDTRPNRVVSPTRHAGRLDPDGTYRRRHGPPAGHDAAGRPTASQGRFEAPLR